MVGAFLRSGFPLLAAIGLTLAPAVGLTLVLAAGFRSPCVHAVIDKALITHRRSRYFFIVPESTRPSRQSQLHHHVGPSNSLKIKDLSICPSVPWTPP